MLGKFRKDKDMTEDDAYGINIGIVENEDSGEADPKEKKRRKFGFKHIFLLGMIITITTATYVFKINDAELKAEEEKRLAEEQKYIEENTEEPHKSLAYYLSEGTLEEQMDSAARSIGHSMATGCSTTYDALRSKFKDESLVYIQDYLQGKSCEEYSRAAVVRLSNNTQRYEYLLTIKDRRERFTITVNHNNESPTSFKVKVYIKNELSYGEE